MAKDWKDRSATAPPDESRSAAGSAVRFSAAPSAADLSAGRSRPALSEVAPAAGASTAGAAAAAGGTGAGGSHVSIRSMDSGGALSSAFSISVADWDGMIGAVDSAKSLPAVGTASPRTLAAQHSAAAGRSAPPPVLTAPSTEHLIAVALEGEHTL